MLAEFARVVDPDRVVGRAVWNGGSVQVEAEDDPTRSTLELIFRPSAALVDVASLRSFGTLGPELLAPGTLRWFIAAAESRSGLQGLTVRLVPQTSATIGWDPAGAYRTFAGSVQRREPVARAPDSRSLESGPGAPQA